MEKYYTPKIEEFCVGFEYEYRYVYNEAQDVWGKEVMGAAHLDIISCSYDDYDVYFEGWYRVKYLDRGDIESLGFGYMGKDDYGFDVFNFYNKIGVNTGLSYHITVVNQVKIHLAIAGYGSYDCPINEFDFYVKNKHELKILLNQLGIEL